jgi:hypothetical protein
MPGRRRTWFKGGGGVRTRETDRPGGVDEATVAWALARRPDVSWSALARQAGVNEHDLRTACAKASAGGARG